MSTLSFSLRPECVPLRVRASSSSVTDSRTQRIPEALSQVLRWPPPGRPRRRGRGPRWWRWPFHRHNHRLRQRLPQRRCWQPWRRPWWRLLQPRWWQPWWDPYLPQRRLVGVPGGGCKRAPGGGCKRAPAQPPPRRLWRILAGDIACSRPAAAAASFGVLRQFACIVIVGNWGI